jgi:hypothetical protein
MKAIHTLIEKNLAGKKVLFLFALNFLIYIIMIGFTIPAVMQYANGMQLLDMMPLGYDMAYVTALFENLGAPGRQAYLYRQLPLDMVYPLLFAVSYPLVMAYFLKKLDRLHGPLFYLCLLPLLAGLADYLENIGIIALLGQFPDLSPTSVTIGSTMSLIKSGATTVYFLALIGILIAVGVKTFKKQ